MMVEEEEDASSKSSNCFYKSPHGNLTDQSKTDSDTSYSRHSVCYQNKCQINCESFCIETCCGDQNVCKIQYESVREIDGLELLCDGFYTSAVPIIGYKNRSLWYMNLKARKMFPGWRELRFKDLKSNLVVDFSRIPSVKSQKLDVVFCKSPGESVKGSVKFYELGNAHFCFLQDFKEEAVIGGNRESSSSSSKEVMDDLSMDSMIVSIMFHRVAVCEAVSFRLLYQNNSFAETFDLDTRTANLHNWLVSLVHPSERNLIKKKMTKLLGQPEYFTLMTRYGEFRRFNMRFSKLPGRNLVVVEISDICNGLEVCPMVDFRDSDTETMAKSRFIATVSHEIRTPLACLAGAVGLLQTTRINEEQQDLIKTLSFCSKTLDVLINNILDYGKITEDQFFLDVKDFELESLLKEALSLVSLQAQSKYVELMVDISPRIGSSLRVHSDEFRIKQVLLNLLNNAIKFTRPGGNVRLYVDLVVQDSEEYLLKFSILDTGIGIPVEKHSSVFAPFSQFHDKSFGGTGLGLAISKKLVEKLGGKISFTSEKGKGSCFTFTVLQRGKAPLMEEKDIVVSLQPVYNIGHVILYFLSPRMSDYVEQLLRSNFVLESCTQVTSELSLQNSMDRFERNPDYDFLVVEELVSLTGDFGTKVAGFFNNGKVHWIHVGALTSFQSPELPRNFKKISKPFISKDFIMLIKGCQRSDDSWIQQAAPTEPNIIDATSKILKILIVDDNPIILTILQKLIHKCGNHIVEEASDGVYAVKTIESMSGENTPESEMFDVIICDMIMNTLNGDDTARRIREMDGLKKQPHIVAYTANNLVADKHRCFKAGMCDFMSKPIKLETLSTMLGRVSDGTLNCPCCNFASQ